MTCEANCRRTATNDCAAGFSLLEATVALALLAVILLSLMPLFTLANSANAQAKRATMATAMAAAKLESLRLLESGRAASPGGTIDQNIAGYVDFLDAQGNVLAAADASVPDGAEYVRRWSMAPSGSDPADPVVLEVSVVPRQFLDRPARAPGRPAGQVRLASIVTEAAR